MAIHKDDFSFKNLIYFGLFIIALFGVFIGFDARYLKAEDYKKSQAQINSSLNRIYIHQLKTEARGIIRDVQFRPATNTERRRLQDIAEELTKLGSTWTIPKPQGK